MSDSEGSRFGKLKLAAVHAVGACIRHPMLRLGNEVSSVVFTEHPGELVLACLTDRDKRVSVKMRIEFGPGEGFNFVRATVTLVNTTEPGSDIKMWTAECRHHPEVGYFVSSIASGF